MVTKQSLIIFLFLLQLSNHSYAGIFNYLYRMVPAYLQSDRTMKVQTEQMQCRNTTNVALPNQEASSPSFWYGWLYFILKNNYFKKTALSQVQNTENILLETKKFNDAQVNTDLSTNYEEELQQQLNIFNSKKKAYERQIALLLDDLNRKNTAIKELYAERRKLGKLVEDMMIQNEHVTLFAESKIKQIQYLKKLLEENNVLNEKTVENNNKEQTILNFDEEDASCPGYAELMKARMLENSITSH